jgi:protein TonB
MIKYQSKYDEEGIRIIRKRFPCCISKKSKVFEVRAKYTKNIEIASIISLVSFIVLFQGWKSMEKREPATKSLQFVLNVEEIPQTTQQKLSPAPSRPSVPIATEDEEVPEDETIEMTGLDFEEIPPPPPPLPAQLEEEDIVLPFVPYDEPPVPVGGFAALQSKLVYPEIARLAGIQGIVTLGVQIDEKGNVVNVKVLKSLLKICDEAAIDAVRSVKWKPAMQRDIPKMVWISVRLEFKLQDVNS